MVRALLNPSKCVPPSIVLILLTKEYIFSEYAVVYCIAISTGTSPSFSIYIGLAFIFSLFLFKNSTNELNPPS